VTAFGHIRRGTTAAHAATAAALIAESFDKLAANQRLVPVPALRLQVMTNFFHIYTEHAVAGAGEILFAGDYATAVWFDHTGEVTEPDDFDRRLAEAVGEFLPQFQELGKAMAAHHPDRSHWYLMLLGVPDFVRGRGLGGGLLDYTLEQLDHRGEAAYLEATGVDKDTGSDNRKLYRSRGFEPMDPPQFTFSDEEIPFDPMWRPGRHHHDSAPMAP
jgi:GNAT superfamily N-acetyltransferase